MPSFKNFQWFSGFLRNQVLPLFQSPETSEAVSYEDWRHRFIHQRLSLGVGLACISYLTFILSQLNNLLFKPEDFKLAWLITQVTVELSLFAIFILLRTPIGTRYPGFIFLILTW
ncbi:MAG: adenylate/guanylate cyclase domain-containing protein, partial [Cyanobacteriota bacterium]|nr:adenylate/guanylate cyclase domain-containing protein [Cyanobacteriota bacterium]